MTPRVLMAAADKLTGIHPGMDSKAIQEALHRWGPGVDSGYEKRPAFSPVKPGTSEAQKRYIARRLAGRERVRRFRLKRKEEQGG
jgi:hypothetical protein